MKSHQEILQAVSYLNAAVSNTRLYAVDHPQVARYLERTHHQLQAILQTKPNLTFLIVDDDVVVDNHVLTTTTPQLDQFVALLRQCAVQRITFGREVTVDGLLQLVEDLSAAGTEAVHSTLGITLGKVKVLSEMDLES